ncbi:MAG: hypothetical protein MR958_04800 [Spirochaetia bacterium]|nr:hypothetical protein [Spirochaetia bacterium]MDD7269691.1 hypothetical protein [Treponema sp.]MDY4985611.1 hypothetical protein [Treponema sp.]
MRKIKFSCIFAGAGFLISFVFGLFSGRDIGLVLLRAIIFALIYALIGFGISFLYEKFLSDDSSDLSSDSINVNPGNKDSVQKGQVVDVTIQDEDLPQGDSLNHFVINDSHQMLNKNDTNQNAAESAVEQTEAVENSEPVNTGFVPLKNFETVNNFSSQEAVVAEVTGVKASTRPSSVDGELDVLPDMENLDFGSKTSGVSDSSSEGYEDSITEFSSTTSSRHKSLEDVGIQDAALMAKAISSALSNDES